MVTLFFLKKAGMGPLFWLFSFPSGKVRMVLMVDGAHPGNSVGVAIPQPRVKGHSDSTLGIYIKGGATL